MAAYTSQALKILEEKKKKIDADVLAGVYTQKQGDAIKGMIDAEINQTQTAEAQEWFKLAEGPGMDAASFSGLGRSGIDYVDQRDITKTFPGAMSEEEDKYQKMLRAYVGPAPGIFKW